MSIYNKMLRCMAIPEVLLNRIRVQRKVLAYRNEKADGVPPITAVLIEICGRCNRRCPLCPQSIDPRETHFLDEDLFYKIIDDLREINFKGKLSFHLFNEPLLDKRLPKFIAYVRKELPKAYIYLNTNGDCLSIELWRKLRKAGLQYASITQYDGKINDNVQAVFEQLGFIEKLRFHAHLFNEKLAINRAGLVDDGRDLQFPLTKFCGRPLHQFAVRYTGKSVLCCNDYYGSVEFGDLRREKVVDIWKKQALVNYRKKLVSGDRAGLQLCETCDM
jgi:hypothetical protein